MSDRRIEQISTNPFLISILGALILMSFALVNGYALFFNDSRSYIRGPDIAVKAVTGVSLAPAWRSRSDAAPAVAAPRPAVATASSPHGNRLAAKGTAYTANRSIYYGVLAFIGAIIGGFWPTVFLQAFATSLCVALLVLQGLRLGPRTFLVTVTALALFTSVGPIVALIMPDAFAPVLIISAATLFVYWDRLSALDRTALFLLAAFSTLAHASHVVLLTLLLMGLGLGIATARGVKAGWWRPFGALAACVVIGLVGQIAFSAALERATGQKPLVLPHMTAHLEDMGPGTRYLRSHCPAIGFALCKFVDRLPMYWEDFLGADPQHGVFAVADAQTQRRLSDEQASFALKVFAYDPVGVTYGMARDALAQSVRFSLKDLQVPSSVLSNYRASFPPDVARRIARSEVGKSPALLNLMTVMTYVSAVLALGVCAYVAFARRSAFTADTELGRFLVVGGMLIGGILTNAIVCGVFASPYDRFQARVIWILPMVAILLFVMVSRSASKRARHP